MLRAVVRFARDVARLPSFPRETPRHAQATRAIGVVEFSDDELDANDDDDDDELANSVLKIVALDPVAGEVLPRTETTWLALLPFEDLNDKSLATEAKAQLVRVRRAFVELLVRLAENGALCWDAATMHCGDMVGPERSKTTGNAFWYDLLCALWPAATRDAEQPLERNLIAMSRARRPRFLLCLDHDVSKGDVFTALEHFLLPPDEDTEAVLFGPEIVDGLPDDDDVWEGFEVEVGLSFARGRISQTAMTQLLDVIDRVHASRDTDGVRFRVTTLRFGKECSFQGRALELLGEHRRRTPNAVRNLRLGSLHDVRAPARRSFFVDLIGGRAFLGRLALSSDDMFVPLAAAIRRGSAAHLEELDACCSPSEEHAAWLAFAFFHVDSRSSVSSLCLRTPPRMPSRLTSAWLTTFTRVLRSVRADQDLAQMTRSSEEQVPTQTARAFVRVQPNVMARTNPSQDSKSLCRLIDTSGEEFELVARYKNSLALIIPGAGVGWVPVNSVLSERVAPSRVPCDMGVHINQRITAFSLDGGDGHFDPDVLMELLSIIGKPLRSLQLPAYHLESKHLAQILACCPNLIELNLSGHDFDDIAPLRDAYEKGVSKIHTLSIARSTYRPIDKGDLTAHMTTILSGKAGHVIRQLVMHTLPPTEQSRPNVAWETRVVPLANAVSAASGLEYLHLVGLNLFANGAPQRLPVDFTARPQGFSPMPLRAKLAFLSVIYRMGGQRSLGRLDASVLGLVFRFGYTCTARRVLKDARLVMDGCSNYRCV